jgi:ribonuclease HI
MQTVGARVKCVTIYTDGASRGNPGPAAAGWILCGDNGVVLDKGFRYLGETTNNVAEYTAVLEGLRAGLSHCRWQAIVRTDSELVVGQLTHRFRLKAPHLLDLASQVASVANLYRDGVSYEYRPRSQPMIEQADRLTNDCLDGQG